MNTIQRESGVVLDLPDTLALGPQPTGTQPPTKRGRLPHGPVQMPASTPTGAPEPGGLLDGLFAQGFAIADEFDLHPVPPQRKARDAIDPPEARIGLDLNENEAAVVLLEQGGVYSWHHAASEQTVRTPASRRGALVVPASKHVVFVLDTRPVPPDQRTRGPIADFATDKIRAFVLKFAAPWLVENAIKIFERNLNRGLVHIPSADAATWKHIRDLSTFKLPQDRPARVLLLVHGTFSTTIGSFGALAVTDWGKTFLGAALAQYDLILGFDHPTLSVDPLENATELLAALETAGWPFAPAIDAIAYSRGALVLRSMAEYLLPGARTGLRLRRAVFVGGTNAGTTLAKPENWERFIDLYTNIAVTGCRLLQMFPPVAPIATAVKECIASVGALVKYIAVTALRDRAAPGLAAMTPDGDFVKRINQQQPGQPTAPDTNYYVVTSNYDASLTQPGEAMPAALVRWLVDCTADGLIGGANDLVVNIESMSQFEYGDAAFVKERLDFGRNPNVFHTVYFAQPQVADALTRWLGLTPHDAERPADAQLPVAATRDFFVTKADVPYAIVARAIRERRPRFVVVERDERGEKYHYAFGARELDLEPNFEAALDLDTPLQEALASGPLALHETGASSRILFGETSIPAEADRPVPSDRTIVFKGDIPHAVVPARGDLIGVDLGDFSGRSRVVGLPGQPMTQPAHPSSPPGSGRRTRSYREGYSEIYNKGAAKLPESASVILDAFAETSEPTPSPPREHYNFGASMTDAAVIGKTVPATVTLSRNAIAAIAGETQDRAQGSVDLGGAKIIVQAVGKANLEVVGDDRVEIEPSKIGEKTELVFDVRGTTLGDGELWVIIRQGAVKLAMLALKPRIVTALSTQARNLSATTSSPGAASSAPALPVLQIIEQTDGAAVTYLFLLTMGNAYIKGTSQPFKSDRAAYVEGIYKEIEGRWLGNKDDVDAFHEKLRQYGGILFDKLVPPEIQEALWKARDTLRAIHVISEEPFIPWELVHLKPPAKTGRQQPLPRDSHFLGQKGLVRWLHMDLDAPLDLKVRGPERAFYAIPDYPHPDYKLPEAQNEIPFLRDRMRARPVARVEANTLRELLCVPGQVDLFHFSGHGEAVSGSVDASRILLTGRVEGTSYFPDYFEESVVSQSSELTGADGNRAMVVLNACQVGRSDWQLTSTGGFAQAFLNAGAGIFLSTLWSVGDAPARTFTEAFYSALLAGKTLAEATIAGREAAKDANEATWLAYVVYGHPYARVQFLKAGTI